MIWTVKETDFPHNDEKEKFFFMYIKRWEFNISVYQCYSNFFCRIWIKIRDWTHKLSRKVCWSIKIRQESPFPIDWTEMFFAATSIAICWPSDRMQVQGFWPGSFIHIVILYSRGTKSCLIYFEEWYEWEKSKNDTPLLYVCKRT